MKKPVFIFMLFAASVVMHAQNRIVIDIDLKQRAHLVSRIDTIIELLDTYKNYSDSLFSIRFNEIANEIVNLENANIRYSGKSVQVKVPEPHRNFTEIYDIEKRYLEILCFVLDLEDENAKLNEIRYLVERIGNFSTIYRLHDYLYLGEKSKTQSGFIKENYSVVREYYKTRVESDFNFYTIRDIQRRKILAIEVNHANDFFDLIPMYNGGRPMNREEKTNRKFFMGNNHDRDMTGAFRLDVYTDFLQMRINGIVTPTLKKFWNRISGKEVFAIDRDPFYSYQSLFITGMGTTPMLRDTALFKQVNSFDPADRPYASFIALGISKNRIHRKGLYRTYQEISVGKIGLGSPYGIQATLHRDIIQGSLNPNGWGAQIAAGDSAQKSKNVKQGRIGIQYLIRHDYTFFSSSKSLRYLKHIKVDSSVNVFLTGQIHYGCQLTAADIGIGYANYAFNFQNGRGLIKKVNPRHKEWLKLSLNASVYYRRVVHNSMLEGFGYIKNMEDGDPFTPKSMHVIENKYIQRNLLIGNFGLSVSKNKVSFYVKYDFTSAEIKKSVDGVNKYKHYFENTFGYKEETFYFKRRPSGLNLWGTLGAVFVL